MADIQFDEKKSSSPLAFLTSNAVFAQASSVFSSLQEKREALGLPNPGTVDNLSKEVERDVFLNNYSFTGLRADITKTFSGVSPLFQVSHQLSMGSQAQPPYTFAALYGSPRVFMQANVDNDLQLMGRFNWRWNKALVTKSSVQLAPGPGSQAMLSLENDYTGSDFTASVKAMNPSLLEGGLTGMFVGDYLQAVTPRLALGINAMWQRSAMNQGPEMLISYAARYKSDDWIATARFLAAGGLQATYWKRIAERVEAGVDLNMQFMPSYGPGGVMGGSLKKEGVATVGAKYEFRTAGLGNSSFRAQVDSQGKLACLLEKRVAPPVNLSFVGEIDHFKNTAKVGLSVSIDAMTEDVMEQQERAGPDVASPPF